MRIPALTLNSQTLSNVESAIEKEWIVANGLGGYASSTVLGINTRKYHGLLVAAFKAPGDRRVCLEKLDEEIWTADSIHPLGANEFQSGIFPKGYEYLEEFSLAPFPKYVYVVQAIELQKRILVPHELNAIVVLYKVTNKSDSDAKVRVFPLVNWRHFHSVTDRWKMNAEPKQKQIDQQTSTDFRGSKSPLIMKTIGAAYHPEGKWIEKIQYREEAKRGESSSDDIYQTGFFEVKIGANRNECFAVVVVADGDTEVAQKIMNKMPSTMYDMEALYDKEASRREGILVRFYNTHAGIPEKDWLSMLVSNTDMFLVRGADSERSVIAGYHWFEAWGRDTFISLPGLMLVTERYEEAREAFLHFSKYRREGLIPNFVPDATGREPAYNSVDATLWFIEAIKQYLKYTGDFKFVHEKLWQTLIEIVDSHIKGTVFGIRMDSDGLLLHGQQLTWMDVAVNGKAVTPRTGKAVEVQALWHNALRIMELLANRFGEHKKAEKYAKLAGNARTNFVDKFWIAEKCYLLDVVGEDGDDASMRPNQIVAVSVDFSMLDAAMGEKVVDVVQRELLTPCGLRTLAQTDPRYRGTYSGDRMNRDWAYHNGTVWPWLLGPFTSAFLKTKGCSEFRRDYAMRMFLLPLFAKQLPISGMGSLSEIFDGDPPHTSRGCVAQAWSVAEPLRAYVEDIMQARPKHEKEVLQVS